MASWLITHPACLQHATGPGHPERPERLEAVLAALETPAFAALQRQQAPRATTAQLLRVHEPDYVHDLLESPPAGLRALDPDTVIGPGSPEAALRAAGAGCLAVDAVLTGRARRAFCAVRPPGHHAEAGAAMGFCLFNNIVVAALQAQAVHGLARIAVVDFDVHHGNGSEHMLAGRSGFLYLSSHQSPLYPGTGTASVVGNARNRPLAPGDGSAAFRRAWGEQLLPALDAFAPELLLISAGFDGHRDDPLASLALDEDDYGWLTAELVTIAERCCQGRIVSTLEGGYALQALQRSAAAHVAALL